MHGYLFVNVFIDFLNQTEDLKTRDKRLMSRVSNLFISNLFKIHILYNLLYKTAFRVVLAEGLTCSHSEHRS